ncbi:MAG: VOC family protein [Ignavibacteria bacterium]|nr:VOC family protein [Ignavibacteria bacterium]
MSNDTNQNPNVKQAVPFFWVLNMEKSLIFYMDGLGFELKNKWEPNGKIVWCSLQLGKASIMLQEYSQTPKVKLGEGVSVYFMCEDALTIYNQIMERGLMPLEPVVGNNLWVVEITDPNGYSIHFESPTDVPEDTLYSEWLMANKES